MKILIQHTDTRRYLTSSNGWTDQPRQARAFLDEVRARDYCIYRRLSRVAVVSVSADQPASAPAMPEPRAVPAQTQSPIPIATMKPKTPKQTVRTKNKSVPAAPLAANHKPVAISPPQREAPQPAPVRPTAPEPAAPLAPATVPLASPSPLATTVAARIDVGLGNTVFIRGQGNGLSWERGEPLHCADSSTWLWTTTNVKDKAVFKLLLNDRVWAQGDDLTVEAGKRIEVVPVFH
jgi:hypothetical protein